MDLSTSRNSPVIDYTSNDFDGFKADLITYAQANYPDRWTDFNDDQFAVVFADVLGYIHDMLHYQLNATLRECFAATVMRRQNLINIGKMLDFEPDPPESAVVDMEVTLNAAGAYPFTITKEDNLFSNGNTLGDEIFFSPANAVEVAAYPVGGKVTVPCIEGERFTNQLIGVSNGLPNQRWQYPQDGVVLSSVSIVVGSETWTRVTNLINSSSTDKHYKLVYNDENQVFVLFGDGIYGAVPANAAEIHSDFRVGGGQRGNLNFNTITTLAANHANIISVTNPEKSAEGTNAQSMKAARNAIPASLKTLERAVTTDDYADLALRVSGVAKARATAGLPRGSRVVSIIAAPSGGGDPSASLKSDITSYLSTRKMVTNRVRVTGPVYKNIRLQILFHVDNQFRASETSQTVRNSIINNAGTGLLDFSQLDFGAITKDANGNPDLLLAQTRLQGYFESLDSIGLDRAEIQRFDVIPQARARAEGNNGSGEIEDASIILNGNQKRREFYVLLKSATQYAVYERIVGFVTGMTDNVMTDDTKIFDLEGISDFAGYKLNPQRGSSGEVTVASADDQNVNITSTSSLFTLTEIGAEYYLYHPTPTLVTVGDEFESADGSVKFTLTAGATPFISGDAFYVDIFPVISDIRLREDEYPQLLEANFTTRSSGGSRV